MKQNRDAKQNREAKQIGEQHIAIPQELFLNWNDENLEEEAWAPHALIPGKNKLR